MNIVSKVKKYIIDNNMLSDVSKVVIGVSGGADSVCLLEILYRLREEFGIELQVVHINHCIRGEEADGDEEFVKQWQAVEYKGKCFNDSVPEIYTIREERVRSKSELIIADLLNKEGIPYRYESPILLSGLGTVYPDFTVLNVKHRKELYWEHLGMMDDSEYVEKALQKIAMYEENGIFQGESLILTYETRLNPISPTIVKLMISQYLR